MRITLGLVLAFSFGCAGTTAQAINHKPVPCTPWGCGMNGTQTTGLAAEKPAVIEAVTLPSGEVVAPK